MCILPGVVLDKISSINKKKFSIGRLTLSISIKFDADKALEESIFIRFFEKDLSPSSDRIMQVETR